jgi:hypothetical protein
MKDFDTESELRNMPEYIVRHFVQNGLCISCNTEASEHRVIASDEMNSEWTICWTETGNCSRNGPWAKHFCVKAKEHPNRQSREEFEELYS